MKHIALLIILILKILILIFLIYFKYLKNKKSLIYNKNNLIIKNYKIALCISGQLRDNKIFCENIKNNFIDIYNPDIFVYISDNNNINESNYIIKELKPKKIIIDNSFTKKNKDFSTSNEMFRKIYLCNKFKSKYENFTNTKYDIVIRIRPDTFMHSYIDFSSFNKKYIYIPKYVGNNYYYLQYLFNIPNVFTLGYCDQLFYCSSENMDKVSEIFFKEKTTNCNSPEKFLKKYIKSINIPVKYFNFNF